MTEDLFYIAGHFDLKGEIGEIQNFGSGHIHETYHIRNKESGRPDYILQRFNNNVFRDPEAVMDNLQRITSHIRKKLDSSGEKDVERKVITPVGLRNGSLMYTDDSKQVWRCLVYIPDHKTYDRAASADQVYEGGLAFGKFLHHLADLPAISIRETIPRFHDLDWRLNQFHHALECGVKERIAEAEPEIMQVRARQKEMRKLLILTRQGVIPIRVVHHDTKINNVLYDNSGKSLCVIDLDTVMPGIVHDDFGDAIRTFTNTGEEDDPDPGRVSMDPGYFKAFATGFLEQTGRMLNPIEKQWLAFSARVMTYMQVLRFLTDFLYGDPYYKIHHPAHNLQRTKAQLKLLESMEAQYALMRDFITEYQP